MNNFSLLLLYILIIINTIKITIQKDPLILKFETQYPSNLDPDNYIESRFINEPLINIKVGTHRQSIPCYLNLNTPTIYISGSNSSLVKTQPKYDESKSTKYRCTSNKLTCESFYVFGFPSIDEICLNEEKTFQLEFYLAQTKFSSNELTYSCILGLGYEEILYNEEKGEDYIDGINSFLSQIKENNIIKKKLFFINYNNYNDNDDNGEIIFGVYPHEIQEKYCESCNEEDLIEIGNIINEVEVIWSIKGYIYMGEKMIYNYLISIEFELTLGFIIGSYNYKRVIEKDFFNEKILNNECFKKEVFKRNTAYDAYYCKKNVDISKVENLVLLIDKIKYKIEFTYDDLFSEYGDYLFFNVLFTQEENIFKNNFILGKPFFKKYPMVFNFNGQTETLGFYQNLFLKKKEKGNENINKNENAINTNNKSSALIWILIIIGIIIISLLVYIIIRYLRRPRKQKVNELIEFFDYSSTQKNI